MFALPHGATGFASSYDEPLPVTGLRAFRTALHAAARAAGGEVRGLAPAAYPLTFHTASVGTRAGDRILLCHAHLPWIAFVRERRRVYEDEFLAPPGWAGDFAGAGFLVLSREQLIGPLAEVDVSGLTEFERSRIRYHGTGTLGGVLFNSWD